MVSFSRIIRGAIFFFIGFAVLLSSVCTPPAPRSVVPAYYHWQTTLALSSAERHYLDTLECKKLYVKVLDIGRDPVTGAIQPYSQIEIVDTTGLFGLEIVPTVFITNAVFQNITDEKIEWLAGKVAAFGQPVWAGRPPTEFQFDCDWTPSTRDAFFRFLKAVKKFLPKDACVSATIRLHQYKFPRKTGVPPVDRGMLMFYNTGDIENPESENSIFSPRDVEKYIVGAPKNYPLPLDLALPVFSWALVYREGELWKIIPEFPANELLDTATFKNVKYMNPSTPIFIIQKGTFRSGHYLRPGDLLRVEAISPDLLLEAARLSAQADLASDAAVAFFHLDSTTIHRYPVQLLDSVCQVINSPEKKH